MTSGYTVLTLYQLADLENYYDMKQPLRDFCQERSIKGTLILCDEGMNGTLAGRKEDLQSFVAFLRMDPRLQDFSTKYSDCDYNPFDKLSIRLKPEIVKMGLDHLSLNDRGISSSSEEWESLVLDPSVIKVDVRNHYESRMGSFQGAVFPETEAFWEFPKWYDQFVSENQFSKGQPFAIFCTGGIRCEKVGAYLRSLGYQKIYRLEGGIFQYLAETGNQSKLWHGNCFVFDNRVAVDDQLAPAALDCSLCGQILIQEDLSAVNRGQLRCGECSAA